jgi:hypothetical protein
MRKSMCPERRILSSRRVSLVRGAALAQLSVRDKRTRSIILLGSLPPTEGSQRQDPPTTPRR